MAVATQGVSVKWAGRQFRKMMREVTTNAEREEAKGRKVWTKELAEEYGRYSVEELLRRDEFFGAVGGRQLYSCHIDDIVRLWERRKAEHVCVFLDEEGVGSGKTTKAAAINALLLAEILTTWGFRDRFNVKQDSKIAVLVGSRTAEQAREITFDRLLSYCASPLFLDYFPSNYRREDFVLSGGRFLRYPKAIRFAGGVYATPMTSEVLGAAGWDIYAATIDEANYLAVVEGSRRAVQKSVYDAAERVFWDIYSRMSSRFILGGKVYGLLSMISNRRYSGDFLSRTIRAIERGEREKIALMPPSMVVRRATWEALPRDKTGDDYFVLDTDTGQVVGYGRYSDDPQMA